MNYLLPLNDRREVADGTMAFWFDTSGTDFSFRAGQYTDITILDPEEQDEEGNNRDLSIASSPNSKNSFMVATRMRNTAFKNNLRKMPLGTKLAVAEPRGSFTIDALSARPAVFIAGGIGITPFRSIVEWATEEKLPRKIYLFYSNRTPKLAAFLEDFKGWQLANKNFTFVPTVTESVPPGWHYETGRINETTIKKYVRPDADPTYYITGSPAMVTGVWQMLTQIGISSDDIKTEEFAGY